MNGEVLFLSHRIPFPPDRGDKIRSHHILKRIAELAPVHVATFADDARDFAEEGKLAGLANSYRLVRRTKPLILAGIESLLKRQPASLAAFYNPEIATYVANLLSERSIGTIYVFSGQMGQYIPADFTGQVICDFVDVDSAKFEAYAERESGFKHWVNARENRLLSAEEARLARRAEISLLVSTEEAALFRTRLNPSDRVISDVRALQNGIDSQFFDPVTVAPEPRLLDCEGPRLIFTGQMDYAPNIEAALRAAHRLLPLIRQTLPTATFHVVGRNPSQELLALHGKNGCHVWGGVDDIRTWLAAADLALVPLEIARGVQNKVLEAMAMALPVVMTSAAACGIGGAEREHFAIADSDGELADYAIKLLSDPHLGHALGVEARRFVVNELSWQATLAPLAGMLAGDTKVRRNAA